MFGDYLAVESDAQEGSAGRSQEDPSAIVHNDDDSRGGGSNISDVKGSDGADASDKVIIVNSDNGIKRCDNVSESKSGSSKNIFYTLGGSSEDIFGSVILRFLSSEDISRFASSSKYCLSLVNRSRVWRDMVKYDFWGTQIDLIGGESALDGKDYQKLYSDMKQRVINMQTNLRIKQDADKFEDSVFYWTNIIDIIQLRLLIPLIALSIFISVLLFCLKYDGRLHTSPWVCAIPFYFLLGFVYFNVYLIVWVDWKRYSSVGSESSRIWDTVWKRASGPLFVLMNDDEERGRKFIYALLLIVSLITTQIVLICWKLSNNYNDSTSYQSDPTSDGPTSWGVILVPLWLLFSLVCTCPWICASYDRLLYFVSIAVLWVPFLILSIGVATNLDTRESGGQGLSKLKLAYFFIPFWVLEAAVLLTSLSFLIFAIYRFRQGLAASFKDQCIFFVLAWLGLAPFISFQVMICVRDSGYLSTANNDSPSAITTVEAFSPILLVLASMFLILAIVLWFCLRTKNQIDYFQYYERSLGTKAVYYV